MNKHSPLYKENPEGDGLVVFIHGFMGSPRRFDALADLVYSRGFSAASLLLPCHGGSAKDFASGAMDLWQEHVDSEIERFSGDYNRIWLVGHSMGGLLALRAAARFGGSGMVCGVFTIACPFKLALFSVNAAKARPKMIFYRKNHPIKAAYISGNSIRFSLDLLLRIRKPIAELNKLMCSTMEILPQISIPVTAVYSRGDELVSYKSLEILKSGLGDASFDQVRLIDSLHDYAPEHERVIIEQALLRSLGR